MVSRREEARLTEIEKEEKIKRLSQEIASLEKETKHLEEEIQPTEDQIFSLNQMISQKRENISLNKAKISELKLQLDFALKQHEIDTLKAGDRLWILHLTFGDRGKYDTVTEDHVKKRMERRESGETKPHLIEVKEKRHDGAFMAKEVKGKQKYIGFPRHKGAEPVIIWQKAAN